MLPGLTFAPLLAGAQAPLDTATLQAVVVSATKTPAQRAALSQSVTLITGEQLRARGIARVSDALRSVPGVAIVQNGSTGSVNTLFLRGGESRYTKVLIDGVAVNAPGGFFDFSHLTTDNIDRIEVVRGPASVVHGADAMSGIVQIFTRQGLGPLAVGAEARAGSHGSREVSADANGASGRARYSIGGAARRTDGILSFNNQYYNGTLSGSAGFAPAENADVKVSARYSAAEFHYPTDFTGAPVDSNSYRVQHRLTVGFDASARLTRAITGRIRAGTNGVSDLTEDISVPFGAQDEVSSALMSRNRRRSAEGALKFDVASTAVTIGTEYVHEKENSVNSEGPVGGAASPTSSFLASRSNKAVYGEAIGDFARVSYTFAARMDDNSDYDVYATYRAGANIPVTGTARLRGSISTAFNAPAFNQLRPTLYTVGSPGLSPERARAWEVAAEQTFARGTVVVSAGYFAQRFADLVQFVPGGPPSFLGSYDNLTEAKSNGFEIEIAVPRWREFSASGSFTYARPEVTRVSGDYAGDLEPGDALLRRPRRSGNFTAAWSRAGIGSVTLATILAGPRPDMDFTQFPSPVVELPAYARLDAGGALTVWKLRGSGSAISLTARVENLLDTDYEDVLNFRSPGRAILVGARYNGGL